MINKNGINHTLIFSRIRWDKDDPDERTLRIATKGNLDVILRIISTDPNVEHPDDAEYGKRGFEVISVCKIDNLFTDC